MVQLRGDFESSQLALWVAPTVMVKLKPCPLTVAEVAAGSETSRQYQRVAAGCRDPPASAGIAMQGALRPSQARHTRAAEFATSVTRASVCEVMAA